MPAGEQVVVVGSGHAGAQAAWSLRQEGWTGGITVIGDEPAPPYHRPPLSKDGIQHGVDISRIQIRPEALYEKKAITLRKGLRVTGIDRSARRLVLDDGTQQPYDKLILATGSVNHMPPIKGIHEDGVYFLRTIADAERIHRAATGASRALILGGGYIGLEAAASLRGAGLAVTVLERESRILARVTSPEMSAFLHEVHHEEGVEIHTGLTATAIRREPSGLRVETKEHAVYEADFVVAGTGIKPDTRLAEEAGLRTGDGIRVDDHCRTSDDDIYAVGDCTSQFHPAYERAIRLESVQNAVDQAKAAAAAIAGRPVAPRPIPWFWSDQYDVKLQMVGLSSGYDDVLLRRHPEQPRSLSAWYFAGNRLIAVDAVNDTIAYAIASKLIPHAIAVDRRLLTDPSRDLKALLP